MQGATDNSRTPPAAAQHHSQAPHSTAPIVHHSSAPLLLPLPLPLPTAAAASSPVPRTARPLAAPSLLLLSRHSPMPSTSTTLLCCAAAYPRPASDMAQCGLPLRPFSVVSRWQRRGRRHLSVTAFRCGPFVTGVHCPPPLSHDRTAPLATTSLSTVAALAYAASPLSAAIGADHSAPRPGGGRRGALRRGRERGGERRERGRRGGTAEEGKRCRKEVRSAAPPHTPHTRTCTCTTQRRARAALDSDRLHSSSASFVVVLPSSSAPPCQLSLFLVQPLCCIPDAFSRQPLTSRSSVVAAECFGWCRCVSVACLLDAFVRLVVERVSLASLSPHDGSRELLEFDSQPAGWGPQG